MKKKKQYFMSDVRYLVTSDQKPQAYWKEDKARMVAAAIAKKHQCSVEVIEQSFDGEAWNKRLAGDNL